MYLLETILETKKLQQQKGLEFRLSFLAICQGFPTCKLPFTSFLLYFCSFLML